MILAGYHEVISRCGEDDPRSGVGLFVKDTLQYKKREDISVFVPINIILVLVSMRHY